MLLNPYSVHIVVCLLQNGVRLHTGFQASRLRLFKLIDAIYIIESLL